MKKIHCIKISIVIALLITSMLLTSCSGATSSSSDGSESGVNVSETSSYVDLLDYIRITEKGVQGNGSISVGNLYGSVRNVDCDEDTKEHRKAYEEDVLAKKYNLTESEADILRSWLISMDIEYERKSTHSNGDVVTIYITKGNLQMDDVDFIELRNTEYNYTIQNLPEPLDELNPFDYLTVDFRGINGEGYVKTTIKEYEPYTDELLFEVKDENGESVYGTLSNGDTVYVTSNNPQTAVKKYTQMRKEFTVSGLGNAVESLDNIDTSELHEYMKKYICEYYADSQVDLYSSDFVYNKNFVPSGLNLVDYKLEITKSDPIYSGLIDGYTVCYKCEVQISEPNGEAVDKLTTFVEYRYMSTIEYNGKLEIPFDESDGERNSALSIISLPLDINSEDEAVEYIVSTYSDLDE